METLFGVCQVVDDRGVDVKKHIQILLLDTANTSLSGRPNHVRGLDLPEYHRLERYFLEPAVPHEELKLKPGL